jgi:hypothetical protein
MEVDLTLASYNPPLVIDNEVFFGALLQNAENPALVAGVEVQLENTNNVINLGVRTGLFESLENLSIISQRSVGEVSLRLRLDRDPANGNITVYINNEQLGLSSLPLADADDVILPVLYVKDGGVVVHVTRWVLTLQ